MWYMYMYIFGLHLEVRTCDLTVTLKMFHCANTVPS